MLRGGAGEQLNSGHFRGGVGRGSLDNFRGLGGVVLEIFGARAAIFPGAEAERASLLYSTTHSHTDILGLVYVKVDYPWHT